LKEGRKDRALIALKKKKFHEMQALQLDRNMLMLDERVAALEATAQQADLITALKAANGAMKQMQKQMPLEDVEQLLQDNAEASHYVVRDPHSAERYHVALQALFNCARQTAATGCMLSRALPKYHTCSSPPGSPEREDNNIVAAVQSEVNALLGQSNDAEAVPDQELDEELMQMEADLMPNVPTTSHVTAASSIYAPTIATPATTGSAVPVAAPAAVLAVAAGTLETVAETHVPAAQEPANEGAVGDATAAEEQKVAMDQAAHAAAPQQTATTAYAEEAGAGAAGDDRAEAARQAKPGAILQGVTGAADGVAVSTVELGAAADEQPVVRLVPMLTLWLQLVPLVAALMRHHSCQA
jgi:hypothetical protein